MTAEFFWAASLHTPLWVYAILLYLMYVGTMLTRTKIVHIIRLLVVPSLLFGLSAHNLSVSLNFNTYTVTAWIVSIVVGMSLGVLQVKHLEVLVDRQHRLLKIPGTWSIVLIILVVFFTKYYFSYQLALDPKRLYDTNFELAALTISGLCSGFSIGRFCGFLYRLIVDPENDLRSFDNASS